jgi:hypothetical protein
MIRKFFVFMAIAMLFIGVRTGIAGADLVSNGSFQIGDLTGWTLSDPSNTMAIVESIAPQNLVPGGPSGNEVVLSTYGTAESISQTIATTANTKYSVNFWVANDDFTGTSYFKALWNGAAVTATPDLSTQVGAFNYTEFTITGTATGTGSTIGFQFLNDNSVYHLTGVSASTAVPIPPTALLFFPALAGLIGLKRRQSTKA